MRGTDFRDSHTRGQTICLRCLPMWLVRGYLYQGRWQYNVRPWDCVPQITWQSEDDFLLCKNQDTSSMSKVMITTTLCLMLRQHLSLWTNMNPALCHRSYWWAFLLSLYNEHKRQLISLLKLKFYYNTNALELEKQHLPSSRGWWSQMVVFRYFNNASIWTKS